MQSLSVRYVAVQEKYIMPKTKSHESVQNKHMFSKFLYYRSFVYSVWLF